MDQKAFKRIQSAEAKKCDGQVKKGASVAKLQSRIDRKCIKGRKND